MFCTPTAGNTHFVSGNASLDLPIQLAVPLAGIKLPGNEAIMVSWPDITDPSTLSLTVTPGIDLANLSTQAVIDGLQNAETFITQVLQSAPLQLQLPVLNRSLAQMIDPLSALNAAIWNLQQNPPTTIDQLVSDLSGFLAPSKRYSFDNNQLQLNLSYGFQSTQSLPLGFNLGRNLGQLADASGSAALNVSLEGTANLGLVIDFSQSTPQFYLTDASAISVGALVNASNINFNTSIGPLGVFIENGSARLDDGTAGQPATWSVGLNPEASNHLWAIADVPSQLNLSPQGQAQPQGQINVVLPVFFPTQSQPLDPANPNIELHVTDLSNPAQTTTTVLPDFQSALSNVSLDSIYASISDGWNGIIQILETTLEQKLAAQKLPVVGTQISKALNFLDQLDDKVTTALDSAPRLAADTVQQAIFNALGPQGLGWLLPSTVDSQLNLVSITGDDSQATAANSVHVELTPDGGAHFRIELSKSQYINIPIDLGLSGLGLKLNGGVQVGAAFTGDLGFGVSTSQGFFVDSNDSFGASFQAQLLGNNGQILGSNNPDTATLALFQLAVTSNSPQPQLQAGITVSLNDLYGNGQLSADDLVSPDAYTVSLTAAANINVHLQATLGGNTNLPHLDTDFHFTWDKDSGQASIGFSDVYLDMGGLIDGIVSRIQTVLQPIAPIVDLLTTPLPVISQLAGQDFSLLDLATDLGYVDPSTADFIEQAKGFLDGNGLSVGRIDLGSFDINPDQADPSLSPGDAQQGGPPQIIDEAPNSVPAQDQSPISGFQIPILQHPTDAFKLLLGQDVTLVQYTMPDLNFEFDYSQFFPIIGPIGANLEGKIGAKAHFDFGFDTYGFREYAGSGFHNPGLIADGFFIGDDSGFQIYGSIAAYAAVDLGIIQVGVGGGLYVTIGFNVHDPNNDGKVHLNELLQDVNTGHIFDASGALHAFLDAYAELDLGFFSISWDFQIADVTLYSFSSTASSTPPPPQLATQNGGELQLNIGPYAAQREYGNTTEGNESVTVTPVPNKANAVYVSGFGVSNQEYDNVTSIDGYTGPGNNSVTVNAPGIDVNLYGSNGNDTFDVQNARNVALGGGSGTDSLEVDNANSATITAGAGTDTLVAGNVPNAVLQAGDGNDTLEGGSGANQQLIGGYGRSVLQAGSGAGQTLTGGLGNTLLIGGSGPHQVLTGGDGPATLIGGTGPDQQLSGGRGTANLFGGTGVDQTLIGGNGYDHIYGNSQPMRSPDGQPNQTLQGER